MIELNRHIEVLLLSNDCVIVPLLGGFVAHSVPARYDEEERIFLPPLRTVGFNPQLKMNDSLLAQSYVEAYDISYPEALRQIEQEVEEMKRMISTDGQYLLENIGTLTTTEDDNYRFEPCESGVLTPALYGLSSFEFPSLRQPHLAVAAPSPATEQPEEPANSDEETPASAFDLLEEESNDTLTVKMSWVRNAIAAAAAILLFFLIPTPVANSDLNSLTLGSLKDNIIYKLIPQDTNLLSARPVTAKPVATETPKKAEADSKPAITDDPYCLVLASQVKLSNAEEFVRQLKQRGHQDTEVYVNNQVVRVVYGHFKSEAEAYAKLHDLRYEENFEEAWVYKKKVD